MRADQSDPGIPHPERADQSTWPFCSFESLNENQVYLIQDRQAHVNLRAANANSLLTSATNSATFAHR